MWLPRYPTLTILAFAGIMLMTDYVPALRNYKLMEWTSLLSVLNFVDRRPSVNAELEEKRRLRPDTEPSTWKRFPLDDSHHDLDRFYQALNKAEEKGKDAVVRILHYGDSPTTADMITSDARILLQKQFGDAGHGFCLVAKPWAWYAHRGADVQGEGWTVDPANQSSIKDGRFGLGGVSFRAEAGALARVRLTETHTRVEIAFLKQPDGGQFRVFAGNEDLGVVDTGAATEESGFASFPLSPGVRRLALEVISGKVRLFGLMFSKDDPGVIYHSLGVNGAYVSVLAKFFNEAHWREQLRHYKPHLVIVNYGTNESAYPRFVDYASEKELREVVHRIRTALPDTSILIMSPMDRGQRMESGEIGTVPAIPRLVAIQHRVAADLHVAFFNTFEAMGGMGTMGRWYLAEPRLVGADFIHPMPGGAKIVGGLLYQAMLDGYNKYKLRMLQQKPMMAGK